MGLWPRQLVNLLLLFGKVGKFIRYLEESKVIRFMKRNRLFTLIPMAVLSYQLTKSGSELETVTQQRDFYRERLNSYYRDWNDLEFGVWEKVKVGDRFVFLGVNDWYEKVYLKTNGLEREDVLGLDNIQAMGEEVGQTWNRTDSIVSYSGGVLNDIDRARYGDLYGRVMITKVRKIRRNGDTTVIGAAIPIDTVQRMLEDERPGIK